MAAGSCQENDVRTLEAGRSANEGKVFVNGCRQLITLHERNFQPFRHSRQPRFPRAINPTVSLSLFLTLFSLLLLLHGPECYSAAPLVFLSPVRVYEYLIRQTGRTCPVNEALFTTLAATSIRGQWHVEIFVQKMQHVTLRLISIITKIKQRFLMCEFRNLQIILINF